MNNQRYNEIFNSLIQADNFVEKVSRIERLVSQYGKSTKIVAGETPVVGIDLDRTMIFSDQSLDLSDTTSPTPLRVAEVSNHKPVGYITSTAYSMLEIVNLKSHLVPVTTRTIEQYRRILLPGMSKVNMSADTPPQHAITTNGGKLLVDGVEDMEWSSFVSETLAAKSQSIKEVGKFLRQYDNKSWLIKRRSADNLFTYLILNRAETPQSILKEIGQQMNEWNWNVSMQGRKFYCVPNVLTKAFALNEVRARVGAKTVIAAGDSLLDIPMLELADHAIRPSHGELEEVSYQLDGLTITDNKGILGGEEIVARILALLG